MKRINKQFILNLLFNVVETLLIFLMGKLIGLPINHILIIVLTFIISRGCFGNTMHFKTWYRCLIWSATIMLSLFLILKVDLVLSILFTVYAAFILTGKSNIKDMYLWNNNNEPSKYQDIVEYIKYNEFDDTLIEFENKLKEKNLEYLIYKYRFKDHKTFAEISDLLEMETPRIAEHLNKIAFAIRIYCKI